MTDITSNIFDGDTETIDALGTPAPLRFYAVSDGWMADKNTFFGRVIVPVDKNPFAKSPTWGAKGYWDIPQLPADLLARTWGFFRAAWETRKSEAMVYLLDLNGQYSIHVPKQRVSMGGVHARLDPSELPQGAQIVGDIHSHCNFSAFHSGTDTADAKKNDGLHITIGEVDKNPAKWAVMLSYSGFIWDLELEDVTEADLAELATIAPPAEWLARIDEPVQAVQTSWNRAEHHRSHPPQKTQWLTQEERAALYDDYNDWGGYWNGYYGYQKPEPVKTDESFASLDLAIRAGAFRGLDEEDIEMIEMLEMDLLGMADILLNEFGIFTDFSFTPLPLATATTTNDTKEHKA